MGKIRIQTLGDESTEEKLKKKKGEKREQKKAREIAVEPVEEAKGQPEVSKEQEKEPKKAEKKQKKQAGKKRVRSKSYQTVVGLVEKGKVYPLTEALTLLPKLKRASFDETVELHINTTEEGISTSATLPHGKGKTVRVAIADDKLIAEVEQGKIDFDILLAEPQMMPKLAKVAKFLGPKGLMPNPKSGTITANPSETAKKYEGGHMSIKTEKSPIIHVSVGKVSFGDKKLQENITTVLASVPLEKIKSVILKSTMSPAIRIQTN